MLRGTTIRKETPLGTMFVNITEDEKGQPFEVFVMLGKAGGSAMADAEAMGRLISLALRSGIPMAQIHRQLRGISSDRAVGLGPNKILSVPDAIGIALEEWVRTRVSGVQQDLPGVNSGLPVGGDNGRRCSFSGKSPIRFIMYFIGIGLVSKNTDLLTSNNCS